MDDQQTDTRSLNRPGIHVELLERIERSRSELEGTLSSLSEEQMTKPGPSGWSIKDHLAHLAVWELGIAALLSRRPRFAAMQVEEAVAQGKSEEEINDLIYRRHAGLTVAEARQVFEGAHRQLLEALQALGDEDLFKPYSAYLPEGSDPRQDPVINWIVGNTFGHFDEHHGYIQAILKEQ